jgi:hypothetical protein
MNKEKIERLGRIKKLAYEIYGSDRKGDRKCGGCQWH